MKKLIYLVAAFSAILTSCSNEDVISGTPQSPTSSTITATISQKGTRVAMGEKYEEYGAVYNPLLWEAGDAVRVINYFAHTSGEYTTSNSGETATFSKTSGEDIVVEDVHIACYPASAWTGYFTEDAPLMFTFPSTQNYTPGTVDRDALPLLAMNEEAGTEFEFMPIAAVLRLNVKTTSTTAKVNSIIITSKSEYLSGTFEVTDEYSPEEADKSATLVCETPVAINSTTGVDFCVVVPSNYYCGGDLTITVNTDKGSFEKTSKNDMYLYSSVYDIDIVGDPMPPTTGTAKATIGGEEVDVNWLQLWENGPKFAEYNVGVTDGKAESYGGYYCWGSSIDRDSNGAYNSGTDDLTGDDDTATNLWGDNWRMPTHAELKALLDNCDVEWTTVNGVYGSKFTGKGDYASNSVFLPAAGICYHGSVYGQGDNGFYWPSTFNGYVSSLQFFSGNQYLASGDRNFGYSVRAVLK